MKYPATFRYDTKKAWQMHWLALGLLIFAGSAYTAYGLSRAKTDTFSLGLWITMISIKVIWDRLFLERAEVVLLDDRIAIKYPIGPPLVILDQDIEQVALLPNRGQGIDVYWHGRKCNIKGGIERFSELSDELAARARRAQSVSRLSSP